MEQGPFCEPASRSCGKKIAKIYGTGNFIVIFAIFSHFCSILSQLNQVHVLKYYFSQGFLQLCASL